MSTAPRFAPEGDGIRIKLFLALPPHERAAMLKALEDFAAEREAQAAAIRDHLEALRTATTQLAA